MGNSSPDFQHNNQIYISNYKGIEHFNFFEFNANNLIFGSIYFSVRFAIKATWINDRDQFLYPNDSYKDDLEFQSDCLAFSLFHSQNRIISQNGVNHWIPFSEIEVGAKEAFGSHFMKDFIQGKISLVQNKEPVLFDNQTSKAKSREPLEFSSEAKQVFKAGLELMKYYHSQENFTSDNPYNANASFYQIREFFQGRNTKGRMNAKSQDEHYNNLIANLRYELDSLAKKIIPKIYKYGFLIN